MKTLTPVEFNDQRILTTEQLAEVYGTEANNIKNNFNNHQDQFIEGKHYYLLQGEDLRAFKNQVNDIDLVSKHTAALYLWTERGASRHCKILDTEKAWEQFDNLEDTYFRVKEMPRLQGQPDPLERKAKLDRAEAMRLNALSRLAKPLTEPEPIMDATAIAKELGIVSNAGIPHAHAVGAIISDLNLTGDEVVVVPFFKNGHASTGYAYKASVCEKVRLWLDERHWPTVISSGSKNYHVQYTEV